MDALFAKVLDMSLTASIVILAVLAARYCLRKAPKVLSYALWSVVLFRLLCPVSLMAPVSVLEAAQPRVTVVSQGTSSISYFSEEPQLPSAPAAPLPQPVPEMVPVSPETPEARIDWEALLSWIWAAGVGLMMLNCLVSYLGLYRRLVGAIRDQGRVYLADHIPTPFVLGIFRPRIYLPSNTPMVERPYILAHEEHHIRRLDHIFKLLAYGALCLHWFNPLVWAAFFLAGKDMEMSCDEAVIRQFGPEIRADYAQSLLRLATNRPIIAGLPLAFGEGDTKGRVKHMVTWRKPKAWVVLVSLLLCAAVLAACGLNPSQEKTAEDPTEYSEPAEGPVTIGIHIPFDIIDVEKSPLERQFFQAEEIPGQISSQPMEDGLLGGIRTYDKPESDMTDMDQWLRDLGVSQIINGGYDYMLSGSDTGDLEASFSDINRQETKHYYFIQGQQVFEVWFDTGKLDSMTQAAMLESIHFAPDAKIERSLPSFQSNPAEYHYLQQCRTALEALQSQESCTVKIQSSHYGGPVLNDTTTSWYYQDGADWLLTHQIRDEGFDRGFATFGYLLKDGVFYTNAGWDENEEILWGEAQEDPLVKPWIARFDWDAQEISYVSCLPAGRGECITLRVMAPYYTDREGIYDYYQMQLYFNGNREFERMENTIFFHNEEYGDYSSVDSIQPMDDVADGAIQYEIQRYQKQ